MDPKILKRYRNYGARVAGSAPIHPAACAPWAMLLPDAADGLLSETEQRVLDHHLAGCTRCSEELAEAQRGLAWLTVLKDQTPEPPSNMLANILAQTTGLEEVGVYLPPLAVVPVAVGPQIQDLGAWDKPSAGWKSLLGFGEGAWSGLMQPRLAMTAAMAFFSICLTLNLLGVSVSQLNAQTLRNGGLHRTVSDTGASLVRSFQGLRVVYRVESRVNEMRAQMSDPDSASSGR